MNIFEKVIIKFIQILSSLFISIFLVLISLWNPVTINNHSELKHLDLGWPLAFFQQDLSRLNPKLPVELGVHSPLEYPFEVFWPSLIINIIIVSTMVFITPFLIKKLRLVVKARIGSKDKDDGNQTNSQEEKNTVSETVRKRSYS